MTSRSSWSHCPPKKSHQTFFFYLCSSNENLIDEHFCTNMCHKSTLSPNNLMLKLIMFVEKTKCLYSRVEIKTLKQGKTMLSSPKVLLDPKLAIALPSNVDLETPTPSPFCLLSVCGLDSYDCIAYHLLKLSSLVCHLFELSSLSISFLHMTPKLSSLICLLFTCGSGSSWLNSCSPFRLLSVHRSSSPDPIFSPLFVSSPCTS